MTDLCSPSWEWSALSLGAWSRAAGLREPFLTPSPALPPRVQQASHQGSLTRDSVSVAVVSTARGLGHDSGWGLANTGLGARSLLLQGGQHTRIGGREGWNFGTCFWAGRDGEGEQGRKRTECCRK